MATRALVVLLSLLALCQCQELHHLQTRLVQLEAIRALGEDGAQELLQQAQKVTTSLLKILTDPGSVEGDGGDPVPGGNCLQAAWNLTSVKDPSGLPVIVDLIDAFGKIQPGILSGNLFFPGSYDECLGIPDHLTQYCMVSVLVPLPVPIQLPFSVGMCLPEQCTVEDIKHLVDMIPGAKVTTSPLVPGAPISCQAVKAEPYHWTAVLMIIVCALILSIVLVCTMVDLLWRNWSNGTIQMFLYTATKYTPDEIPPSEQTPLIANKPKPRKFDLHEWVQTFSLLKTVSTVLSTTQPSSAITSLNGLRVMSILWVILCHTFNWVGNSGADNILDILSIASRFSFQVIVNGHLSVDSFFFLSGLLVAYLTLRQMKRNKGKFPIVMFYVHRYLRLTPVYAFVLFFCFFLFPLLGDGPRWKNLWFEGASFQACEKYWWTNLLYINNLYPWRLGEECIGWTWYLANDMQFYIISPLIIIPMYFLFPVGLLIASTLLLGSFIITAVLTGVYDFQTSDFASFAYQYYTNETESRADLLYIKPWHRIQPYLVGLVLGYILYKNIKVPFNRYFRLGSYLFMWGLAIVLCMSSLYGLWNIWHGHIPSQFESIIYNTFFRFAWALGLALLVYICHRGYGGWVNSFLSMRLWIPLSRMAFNAYLIHPVVLTVVFNTARLPLYCTDVTMAVYAVGVAVISFGAAFILTVFVEFPFGNLEMVFFKLFGVGARESARTDTEAKAAVPSHDRPLREEDRKIQKQQ